MELLLMIIIIITIIITCRAQQESFDCRASKTVYQCIFGSIFLFCKADVKWGAKCTSHSKRNFEKRTLHIWLNCIVLPAELYVICQPDLTFLGKSLINIVWVHFHTHTKPKSDITVIMDNRAEAYEIAKPSLYTK